MGLKLELALVIPTIQFRRQVPFPEFPRMACGRSRWKRASVLSLALLLFLAVLSYRRVEVAREGRKNGATAPAAFRHFAVPFSVRVQSPNYSRSKTDETRQLASHETPPMAAVVSSSHRGGYKHDVTCGGVGGGGGGGFAVSLSFHDQQTWACGNLFALQHWAQSLNLTVLEPFLARTTLVIPRRIGPSDLPLSTIYDMDHWNEIGRKSGNAPAVTWGCFLKLAPRKLILVCVSQFIHDCDKAALRTKAELLIISHGFQVVRDVYLKPQLSNRFSVADFNRRILGNFSADEVTVVFSEWSQMTVGDVLDMKSAHFPMALSSHLPLIPSKMIERDVNEYIARYLSNKKGFVAILLRTEWIQMYSDLATVRNTLLNCFNRSLAHLQQAMTQAHSESVFLGMDIGRYGSATIRPDRQIMTRSAMEEHFFNSVFVGLGISEWEQRFEAVSQSQVPGYVALLQRSVAIRGRCLLLVGSGSFLRQALHQYLTLHPNRSEQCYLVTDGFCTVVKSVGIHPS